MMISKYHQLNDLDWLKQKYLVELLSASEIARLIGAKCSDSVRQAVIAAGIKPRNVSDGLTCKRKGDSFVINRDVITGCLLGDAYLRVWNNKSDLSCPSFHKKNKFHDHISYVAKLLLGDGWSKRVKESGSWCNGRYCKWFQLSTLAHSSLVAWYREWYPENTGYKKIVPNSIVMNREVLLHWFLDDGYSCIRKRKYSNGWVQRKKQIVLGFCSESFTKEHQELLCGKVEQSLNLKFSVVKCQTGTKFQIRVPQSQVPHFYEVIGPSPVQSLAYKWK